MKISSFLTTLILAGGLSTTAMADDWNRDRVDYRLDIRDMQHLRADVQRDEWRLREDIRCGRDRAAARDAADLARDRRALNRLEHDMRHDRADMYRDRFWR